MIFRSGIPSFVSLSFVRGMQRYSDEGGSPSPGNCDVISVSSLPLCSRGARGVSSGTEIGCLPVHNVPSAYSALLWLSPFFSALWASRIQDIQHGWIDGWYERPLWWNGSVGCTTKLFLLFCLALCLSYFFNRHKIPTIKLSNSSWGLDQWSTLGTCESWILP